MERRLEEFVTLFNTRRFFEAHEVLESLWLETEQPVKDFYKALVQCAVAFAHVRRGNKKGALSVWDRSKRVLQNYPPIYESIRTAELVEDCEQAVQKLRDDMDFEFPIITIP